MNEEEANDIKILKEKIFNFFSIWNKIVIDFSAFEGIVQNLIKFSDWKKFIRGWRANCDGKDHWNRLKSFQGVIQKLLNAWERREIKRLTLENRKNTMTRGGQNESFAFRNNWTVPKGKNTQS